MNYFTYFALYFIIGFVICMSYLIYKTLTDKDDDADFAGFFALMLFYFWPIVIPISIFTLIKRKKK